MGGWQSSGGTGRGLRGRIGEGGGRRDSGGDGRIGGSVGGTSGWYFGGETGGRGGGDGGDRGFAGRQFRGSKRDAGVDGGSLGGGPG